LTQALEHMKNGEGQVVLQSQQAWNHLKANRVLDSKRQLESMRGCFRSQLAYSSVVCAIAARQLLDSLAMADPSAHSAYHRVALEYFKVWDAGCGIRFVSVLMCFISST
jgi:hypothetical protein